MVTPGRILEAIKGIFIALFFAAFIVGASLSLDAVLCFSGLLLIYFIIQVIQDRNNAAILIGVALGLLLGAVRPDVLPSTLDTVKLLLLSGLIYFIITRVIQPSQAEKK